MPRLAGPAALDFRSPLAYAHAEAAFLAEVAARDLHVHHRVEIEPGEYRRRSCAHHMDGLETLCQACHLAEHAARRSDRPQQMELFRLAA